MKKFIFLAGLAVGFLAGSRAGRGPYNAVEEKARAVANDPRVQEKAGQARDTAVKTAQDAATTVKEKAPVVAAAAKDKAADAASTAKDKASDAASTARHKAEDVKDSATSNGSTPSSQATHRAGDSDTAPDADTDSRAAVAGGEAEVGDKKLES